MYSQSSQLTAHFIIYKSYSKLSWSESFLTFLTILFSWCFLLDHPWGPAFIGSELQVWERTTKQQRYGCIKLQPWLITSLNSLYQANLSAWNYQVHHYNYEISKAINSANLQLWEMQGHMIEFRCYCNWMLTDLNSEAMKRNNSSQGQIRRQWGLHTCMCKM